MLILLNAIGNAVWAVGQLMVAVVSSQMISAASSAGFGSGVGDDLARLTGVLVGLSMVLLVVAAVELWAYCSLGDGRPAARSVVSCLIALDVLAGVALLGLLGAGGLALLVVGLPVKVTLLVLLWVPDGSRRHFAADAVPPDDLDAPTVRFAAPPADGRDPRDQRLGAVPLVLAGVVVVALLVVAALAVNSTRPRDPAVVASGLTECARTFHQEWGSGLATSASGNRMTRAAIGLAIANGSFDSPSGTPRRVLQQVYGAWESSGRTGNTTSDDQMAAAIADPRFLRCSSDAASLRGDETGTLAVFGCVPRESGPFRMDCR